MLSDDMINKSVIIDFDVLESVQYLMDECESLNIEGNPAYYNYAETLGYLCKEMYVEGKMTKEQWDTIERRYEPGW